MERIFMIIPEAIKYIGKVSQSGINPKKIIENYERGNIDSIYKFAKKGCNNEFI